MLHGPASGRGWTDEDAEVWAAMVKERDAGRTRLLGVSNVSMRHLEQMANAGAEAPAFVQNRCFARLGWDREIRAFCREALGMLPLTGASDAEHMKRDLASRDLALSADEVRAIESLVG